MRPLAFDVSTFNIPDGIPEHIRLSMKRGLPEIQPAICSHDGVFVVVGSGPSLRVNLDGVREEKAKGRPICAVKGAHDFLVENGVEPDLFLSLDPRDRRNNVKLETDNTVYLLASRCAPELFEHLKDRKVMIWHPVAAEDENEVLRELGVITKAVGGPSTSGLRAVYIGYIFGFRRFVFFGMDSCNAEDGITKRVDGSLTGATQDIYVGDSYTKYVANTAMALQAQDFQMMLMVFPNIEIDIRGGGLLAAIQSERKRKAEARMAA